MLKDVKYVKQQIKEGKKILLGTDLKEFKEYIEQDAVNIIGDLSKEVRQFEKQ